MTGHQPEDLYEVLNLAKTCSQDDIKKAYRKSAKIYHPDKNTSKDGEEKFKRISAAYEVLKDEEKRRMYDEKVAGGGIDKRKMPNFAPRYGVPLFAPGTPGNMRPMSNPMFNIPQPKADPPLRKDLAVSLEELHSGKCTKQFKFIRTNYLFSPPRKESEVIAIDLQPGCRDGTKITFPRKGDLKFGVSPADLIFVVRCKPHPIFGVDGYDLVYKTEISLKDALLGTTVNEIPILSGGKTACRIAPCSNPETKTNKIANLGIHKNSTSRGDLRVHLAVKYPRELSNEAMEAVKKYFP